MMVTFSVGLVICFVCPEDQNERRVVFSLAVTQPCISPKHQVEGFAEHFCGRREFLTQLLEQLVFRRAVQRGAGLKKAGCFCCVPEYPFDISHMGDGNI